MAKTLFLLIVEHVRQRPIRSTLTVIGVAIGVAAWLAIRLANVEVFRVFQESVDTVVGHTTIQISGGKGGFDERVISQVRNHPDVVAASPLLQVSGIVLNEGQDRKPMIIWGLDFIEYVNEGEVEFSGPEREEIGMEEFLDVKSVFLGKKLAQDWDLQVGDEVDIQVEEQTFQIVVRGLVASSAQESLRVGKLVIMDVAAAQSLFGRVGQLDQINVATSSEASVQRVMEELREALPPSMKVTRPTRRPQQVEGMIKTFQLNLTMLSAVGLLVGIFLVYNTVSFSVVQHRREIGILRALGMSRFQVSTVFLSEATLVGLVGGLLGCSLGVVMAKFVVSLVGQSVSDLYTTVEVQTLQVPMRMLIEGSVVGIGVSLLGALRPSSDAATTAPVKALAPGDYEVTSEGHIGRLAWLGVGVLSLSALLALLGPVDGVPLFGYASAFLLLLGCTLFGPLMVEGLGHILQKSLGNRKTLLGALAADQLRKAPGRNSVTLSALVVGLAIMVGVGVMISSFRNSVEVWIDQTFLANLIVAPASWMDSGENGAEELERSHELVKVVQSIAGVAAVDPYREVEVEGHGKKLVLVSRDLGLHAQRSQYLFEQGKSEVILQEALSRKGVIVSEVLAERIGVEVGQKIELSTSRGSQSFPVVGKFYDYATDGGKVVMDAGLYRRLWEDQKATVLAVYTEPGVDLDAVRRRIEDTVTPHQPVDTISNGELREEILAIFDRTFRVTYVLEFIALSVALLGIVNTLVTGILERRREFATLRALGASAGQIRRVVFWESAYLAFLGAILGLIGGMGLSVLLVKVINKQSFGWTIQMIMPGMTLFQAVCVAGLAGLIAGYFPARWAARQSIADGLRYE